jgi:hypothetical protein
MLVPSPSSPCAEPKSEEPLERDVPGRDSPRRPPQPAPAKPYLFDALAIVVEALAVGTDLGNDEQLPRDELAVGHIGLGVKADLLLAAAVDRGDAHILWQPEGLRGVKVTSRS